LCVRSRRCLVARMRDASTTNVHACDWALGNCGAKAGEEIPWKILGKTPRNRHWSFAFMTYIGCGAQQPESAIIGCQSCKRQYNAAVPLVILISPASNARFTSAGLSLPMKERLTDCEVSIARGG